MTTLELTRTRSFPLPTITLPARPTQPLQVVSDRPAKLAFVAAVAAVPPVTVLHLTAGGSVEPAGWTISDYVVHLSHGTLLFGLTAAALAFGAGILARALAPIAGMRPVRILLAVWAAAMVVAVAFPTNLRGTPETLSSTVHLYAGAVLFAVMPAVGWVLTRQLRRAGARRSVTLPLAAITVASAVTSAALIFNRLPAVFGASGPLLPPGILQRSAGALEMLLLAVAALAVTGLIQRRG